MLITGGIIFPGRYHEDVCWHVQRGGPISKMLQQAAAKWQGAIYTGKIKLISDLNIHHFNYFRKAQQYWSVIWWNDPFQKFISWIYCRHDEAHPPVKLCEREWFGESF